MASVTVRPLDPNTGEPLWGVGNTNFVTDIYAVAQLIKTRLLLFQGEFWADLDDGTPYWQSILGQPANQQKIVLLLTQRIFATPFVSQVLNSAASFDTASRSFNFNITVQTQFGILSVSNMPTPQPQGFPA
jgi:hypothetical protein